MRRVTGKYNAAMTEFFHTHASECIDTHPFQVEFDIVSQQRTHTGNNALGCFFQFRVCIPAQLKIDTPNIIGFTVQKY